MKKRILLSVLMCCALMLTLLAACDSSDPADDTADTPSDVVDGDNGDSSDDSGSSSGGGTIYTIDFTDPSTDFLFVNVGSPNTDPDTSMAIGDADGEKALGLTAPNGLDMRLGINVDGLLGSAASTLKTIVFEVYADIPDGNFNTVGGEVLAMSGETAYFSRTMWTIGSENRNPLEVVVDIGADSFPTAGPNIIEFAVTKNGPAERGDTPAVVYIKSITFYDTENLGLAVDLSAGWAGPEGYGDVIAEQTWPLPVDGPTINESIPGYEFYTWGIVDGEGRGVDNRDEPGVDDYLPWEVLRSSYGIVFETADPASLGEEGLNLVFICFGAYNGWGWTQTDPVDYTYEDGKLTVLWENTPFDPLLVTEADYAVKLIFRYWDNDIYGEGEHLRIYDDTVTTGIYLLYY